MLERLARLLIVTGFRICPQLRVADLSELMYGEGYKYAPVFKMSGFQELAELTGRYYDDVDDPVSYVESLR